MPNDPISSRPGATIGRGGLVDLRDWRLAADIEQLQRAAGTRVIAEIMMQLASITLARSELEGIVQQYVAKFCRHEARG